MKCLIKTLIFLSLVLPTIIMPTYAFQGEDIQKEIQPRFTYINIFQNRFNISSSGMASVEVFLLAYDVDQVEVIAQLQQYRNGSWTTIKTWSDKQYGTSCGLGANWYVASGYSYRLVSYGYTYKNNMMVEQTEFVSPAKVY